MLDPMSLEGMFAQYGRSLLWAITAAVGFGLGVVCLTFGMSIWAQFED